MAPLLSALRELLHRLNNGFGDQASHDAWAACLEALSALYSAEFVILLSSDGEYLRPVASHGLPGASQERLLAHPEIPLSDIAIPMDSLHLERPSSLPLPLEAWLEGDMTQVQEGRYVALREGEQLLGILVLLARPGDHFDDTDQDMLTAAADLMGACLGLAHQGGSPATRPAAIETARAAKTTYWRSPPMRRLNDAISLVAPTDMSVLLLGETGVGKERVAHELHVRSARHKKPFVRVNCAALPEHLIESELFGHSRGAFSGAIKGHRGHFSRADGGTLMLDEIGELPLPLQPKLLRALQEGEIQPLGSEQVQKIDVRVITVTNRNLAEEVAAGRFREDLYHRLSAFPLQVPALRERQEDLSLLMGEFLEDNRIRLGLASLSLTDDARNDLAAWHWPGNVRELEHTLSRAALRALGERLQAQRTEAASRDSVVISASHLDFPITDGAPIEAPASQDISPPAEQEEWLALREATENFQRRYIQQVLTSHANNWAATARTLAIDNGNLHRLGKRLGLK